MKKIVLITPFLQPYRLTFYEKLANDSSYEFTVFHGVKTIEDGRPGHTGKANFREQGFKEYKRLIGPYEFVYNKGMYAAIKEIDPDVIIMQTIAANLSLRRISKWAKKNDKKVIQWVCGWEPERVKGLFRRFKNLFVKPFLNKADFFLTYSTKASDYIKSFNIEDEIVETSYNGIEIDHMVDNESGILKEAGDIRKEYGLNGYTTFLYVGGFHKEKRLDLLVEAFSKLSEKYDYIKLLLIGDGPVRSEIEELIKNMGTDNIDYLGRIIEGVDGYFAASDCLVLPGVGGLALNQAMFWGKPCIVSEADGTEDDLVIEGYSGYRFNKDDLQSLTDAMERRINESDEQLSLLSRHASELIKNKSNVNNMVHVFSKHIDQMIS